MLQPLPGLCFRSGPSNQLPLRRSLLTRYRGQFVEDSDSEVPNVQVGTFEYADGTLAEIDATTLYSPTFGGTRMEMFFYTEQGYVSSVDDWTTTRGQFTPGDRPDPPSGASMRKTNLSFPKME